MALEQAPHPTRPAARLIVPALAWVALVVLLVVVVATPGRYGDQAAPYRLVAYPLLALVLPGAWLASGTSRPLPAVATTLVVLPFVVDTIGNIGDLYGRISWWDDLNHFSNWLLLCGGIGLALVPFVRPRWALVVLVVGLGSFLALGWELGERQFFYSAPFSGRLYEDTLGDETLGTLGAAVAAVVVALVGGRGDRSDETRPRRALRSRRERRADRQPAPRGGGAARRPPPPAPPRRPARRRRTRPGGGRARRGRAAG